MSHSNKKESPKTPIALNYVLAGKWDVVDRRTWKKYCRDFSTLPFEQRTDGAAAEKKILGTNVSGLDLTWKMYDPIDTVSGYASQKTQENSTAITSRAGCLCGDRPYDSLIRTHDTPLYGESQFFSQPIRKIIYNSNNPGSKELSSIFYLDGLKASNPDRVPLDEAGQPSEEDAGNYYAEYVIQHYDSFSRNRISRSTASFACAFSAFIC